MEMSSNLSYRNDLTPGEIRILDQIMDADLEQIMAMLFRFNRKYWAGKKNVLHFVLALNAKYVDECHDGNIERGLEGYHQIEQNQLQIGLEIANQLATEEFTEKELQMGLKLAHGRYFKQTCMKHKMGGRKSRIELIVDYIKENPFTKAWYRDMQFLEETYARSTIYEALKILFEKGKN